MENAIPRKLLQQLLDVTSSSCTYQNPINHSLLDHKLDDGRTCILEQRGDQENQLNAKLAASLDLPHGIRECVLEGDGDVVGGGQEQLRSRSRHTTLRPEDPAISQAAGCYSPAAGLRASLVGIVAFATFAACTARMHSRSSPRE